MRDKAVLEGFTAPEMLMVRCARGEANGAFAAAGTRLGAVRLMAALGRLLLPLARQEWVENGHKQPSRGVS